MLPPEERSRRLDDLRRWMERLCAPDLTLAEAKAIRLRVADLLDAESAGGPPQAFASPRTAPMDGAPLTAC